MNVKSLASFLCWMIATGAGAAALDRAPQNAFKLPVHRVRSCFFVTAWFGKEGPFNLVLDTGAASLAVSPEVGSRLAWAGVIEPGEDQRIRSASGTEEVMRAGKVGTVYVGEWAASHVQTVVFNPDTMSKLMDERVDGIAGMEIFKAANLELDYGTGEAWVFRNGFAHTNSSSVPLACGLSDGVLVANVEIGGEVIRAIVDSGANSGFEVPLTVTDLPLVAPPVIVTTSAEVAGITKNSAARLATNVSWGTIVFEKPVVSFSHPTFGRIGGDVLKNFRVGLDQRGQLLWLTPVVRGPIPATPVRSLGLSLLPEGKRLKVIAVIPNTDAAKAGIVAGEYVLALNGEPAEAWRAKRLFALRDEADSYEIDLERPAGPKHFKLKVNVLIP